jgi:G patch domain/KOW motif-containing protein
MPSSDDAHRGKDFEHGRMASNGGGGGGMQGRVDEDGDVEMSNGGSGEVGGLVKRPTMKSFTLGGGKRKENKTRVQLEPEKKQSGRFVESISTNVLQELQEEPNQSIVIPMITQNVWMPSHIKVDEKGEAKSDGSVKVEPGVDTKELSLDERAARSLIQSAEEKAKPEEEPSMEIPLLMRNAVPGLDKLADEDAKYKHDVSMRPDANQESYEHVSVSQFGEGMLRGMGWAPGAAIGVSNPQVVEPIEYLSRGERLGLGAAEGAKPTNKKAKKFIKPGESREEEQKMRVAPSADGKVRHYKKLGERLIPVHSLRLRSNALVEFTGGPHWKLFGRIVDLAGIPENQGVAAAFSSGHGDKLVKIRLNISEETVSTTIEDIQILDEHALPRDHPAFDSKTKKRRSVSPPLQSKRSREIAAEQESESGRKQKKSKRQSEERSGSGERDRKKKKKKEKRDRDEERERRDKGITWVAPNIRVRIISKTLGEGKYYNKKARVEDVVSRDEFILVLEDGKLIEHVNEHHVESALPKPGGQVMIVLGQHKGRLGTLIKRDKDKVEGVVHLQDSMESLRLPFEHLAEYVR